MQSYKVVEQKWSVAGVDQVAAATTAVNPQH